MDIGYRKVYKLRQPVPGRRYIEVAVPFEVIERQATIAGITIDEYLEQFEVVAEYDNFEGVRYTFRKIEAKA